MSQARSPEDTETVWTATATNRAGSTGKKVFHTDPTCKNLEHAGSSASHPRSSLNDRWRICDRCAGKRQKTGEARIVVCPRCGRECKNMPRHIRGCDG